MFCLSVGLDKVKKLKNVVKNVLSIVGFVAALCTSVDFVQGLATLLCAWLPRPVSLRVQHEIIC